MKSTEPDSDETVGSMGPTTCPIPLTSPDFGLRGQCDPTRDGSNPKEDAMMKMIADRVGTTCDPTGGMKSDDKRSRSFS